MKVKISMLVAALAVLMFTANVSFGQTDDAKKKGCTDKTDCSTTGSKENCCSSKKTGCTDTKTGNSQGITDTAKICPVSGETIDGSEGAPVNFTYLGKEYTFCCAGCVKKFKAEPINYIKGEVNCPVMGEPIDKTVSTTVDGVKYYFCCAGCISKFEKDPNKYLGKLGKN